MSKQRNFRNISCLAALMMILLLVPATAFSNDTADENNTYEVNTAADTVDALPGDGICADADGNCTLRAAIMEANATQGVQTINIPQGRYKMVLNDIANDPDATTDYHITDDLQLYGSDEDGTIIGPENLQIGRVFTIASGVTVVMSNLRITGGDAVGAGMGGGISNEGGILYLNNVTLQGNAAYDYGGGIYQYGAESELYMSYSTILGNYATYGGGIYIEEGFASIINSTISDNEAYTDGGGIYNRSNMIISDTVIMANSASSNGGGIHNTDHAQLTVSESYIYGNRADDGNGGGISMIDIDNEQGSLNIEYSVITDNLTTGFGGAIYITNTNLQSYDIHYNTIENNTSEKDVENIYYFGSMPVSAEYNYWGMDGEELGYTISGFINYTPWYIDMDMEHLSDEYVPIVFTVNTAADTVDANVGDGLCADADGYCSLRAAIQESNDTQSLAEIILPGGTYTLTRQGADEDDAGTGDLDIIQPVTIRGDGTTNTIIDGSGIDRVFDILQAGSIRLSGVTITGGRADDGGGIRIQTVGYCPECYEDESLSVNIVSDTSITGNEAMELGGGLALLRGELELQRVEISNNSSHAEGGGLYNEDTLYLSQVRLVHNTSDSEGGAIYNNDQMIIIEGDLHDNSALYGGGIANDGQMTVEQTTISGNTAEFDGGGILNNWSADISNSTIANNSARLGSGILVNNNYETYLQYVTISGNSLHDNGNTQSPQGSGLHIINVDSNQGVYMMNSIIYGNPSGTDCVGAIQSYGSIILGNSSCTDSGEGTLIQGDPMLGELTDNGGFAPTLALLPGSPAIDATIDEWEETSIDQRGIARPQGFAYDLGAVEMASEPTEPLEHLVTTSLGYMDSQSIRYIGSRTSVAQFLRALTISSDGYAEIIGPEEYPAQDNEHIDSSMTLVVTWPDQTVNEYSLHTIGAELDINFGNSDGQVTIDEIVRYLMDGGTYKDLNFDDTVNEADIHLFLMEIMPFAIEI